MSARFTEIQGGRIIDRFGREVVRVGADDLTTSEAARVVRAIIVALEAEFPAIVADDNAEGRR